MLANQWVFGDKLTGRRFVAFLLDAALSIALALVFLEWRHLLPADTVEKGLAVLQAAMMILVFYRFVCLALTGATLGMAAVGLRLVDTDGGELRPGQALGRSVAAVAFIPFAAALAAVFGPRYQVLEDSLSATDASTGGSSVATFG